MSKGFMVSSHSYKFVDDSDDPVTKIQIEWEDATLREAISCIPYKMKADEFDSWSRILSFYNANEGTRDNIEQGIELELYIHIPAHISNASCKRIARLLGIKNPD